MTEKLTADLRRRSFLAWCGSAGLGSTLFPGALWAQTGGSSGPITPAMIDAAAQLAGLRFSSADRDEMVAGINANLAGFEALREIDIDQNVPPPLYFNPAVPGQQFDDVRRAFRQSRQELVRRPRNLEEIAFWPVTDLAQLLESQQVTSVELTRLYIDRIKRFDDRLNSVVTLTEELAMSQAIAADAEIAAGEYKGPLHGIPWGAKDVIAKQGYRTTWGSEAYRDQFIGYDATVVSRLEAAGAVLIAKLSTGEIARGDRWLGKRTRNPWKIDEGSGGSSAGPGSATAAGLVGFSIGTDTTGSILGPSRTCGISGLRPTFGRVSRHGVMPVCWSLDKVGPMCRTVEDCAIVFDAIYGPDNADLAVVDRPFNWDGSRLPRELRVGFLREAFEANADPRENAVLDVLRDLGLAPKAVQLAQYAGMDALQMLLVDEAAAFDELVHSGKIDLLIQDRDDPEDMLMRIARLMPAVEYLQIQRLRMLMMQNMAAAMRDIDVFVAPHSGSPVTSATSLTGHPAMSVPTGFDVDDKPSGILIVGALYQEADVMSLAKAYQDATGFHRRRPPLFEPR